jgi:hypothetical protein
MSGTVVFVGDTGVCDPPALEVAEEGTGDWVVKLPSLNKNEFQAGIYCQDNLTVGPRIFPKNRSSYDLLDHIP